MNIAERLKQKKTFSFEVFPPKEDRPLAPLLETLSRLYQYEPDFISVTYGAGGTNRGRSLEVCQAILAGGCEPLTHFTCIGNSARDIDNRIAYYVDAGIQNVLVLRGDLPEGWEGTRGDFAHASELLSFLRKSHPGLSLSVTGYPEKHIEADSFDSDIRHLKHKQDLGAAFIVTQLCHDVGAYSRWLDQIRKAGVHLPVIAGVMPILSREGLIRMSLSNGCAIPTELAEICGRYEKSPQEFKKAGKEYTVRQLERYLRAGIDGLHLYTLNKYQDIADILDASGILQRL